MTAQRSFGPGTQDAAVIDTPPELMPVHFVHSPDEASRCCDLLDEMGVPAVVGDWASGASSGANSVASCAILVPEGLHDRAGEILSSVDATSADDWDDDLDDDDEEDEEEDDDEDDDIEPDDADLEDADDDGDDKSEVDGDPE